MAKKKAPVRKKKAASKPRPVPKPKFPPTFDCEGVLIRNVDYMPIGSDTDSPNEWRKR